jgi:probable rRNA maturation factor
MNYRVHIRCDPRFEDSCPDLATVAEAVLADQGVGAGELTVVLTDEGEIRDLNRRFAGRDAPTDVLSFPDGSMDPDTETTYYGDVVIAVPIAQAQASSASHSLQTELALLTIHGVLHLLGHDHKSAEENQRMLSTQAAILKRLGDEFNFPGAMT